MLVHLNLEKLAASDELFDLESSANVLLKPVSQDTNHAERREAMDKMVGALHRYNEFIRGGCYDCSEARAEALKLAETVKTLADAKRADQQENSANLLPAQDAEGASETPKKGKK